MRVNIDLKPIPKYIEKRIFNVDKKSIVYGHSTNRFYCYFTKMNKTLIKVTVAVRNKGKIWACKQVAVHLIHGEDCMVKDMEFFFMSGYVVGWYDKGLSRTQKYWEDGFWYSVEDKYFDPYAKAVNAEYLLNYPAYKYSAIDKYRCVNYFKYLRLYEKYPIAEMLVKCNLSHLATSKTILKELTKNKRFRKWVYENKLELQHEWFDKLAILRAFKNNQSLTYTQQILNGEKEFAKNCSKQIREYITKSEHNKFIKYITTQKTNYRSYEDYFNACRYLNIDMNMEKNRYPHDFKKWHDIRIDEYHTAQAEADKKKRKELYKQFLEIANKYAPLQRSLNEDYAVIIAKSPAELPYEGEKLNHCVGRMNYDQKFVREESLIFFIRNKDKIDKPFVTVEYSLDKHKVLQCYGYNDSKPKNEVLEFVNKKWLPYANKKLRKLVA